MRTQTMMLIGLLVAMIVLLAFVWYTWPQSDVPTPTVPVILNTTTTTFAATSTPATSSRGTTHPLPVSPYPQPSLGENTGVVQIGGQTIYVDLDVTPAQQELGLGNRTSLGANQGMLFLFPYDDIHMFWMKDMSFSIDMIWMSDDGTIIYIQPNVAPETYPEAFGPSGVSRYVLEVPANFAVEHGIQVGDRAVLP